VGGYILKRLGLALAVALAVSMIAFLLLRLSGDPAIAIAGEGARAEDIEMVRKTYGFDRPLPVQYVEWLGKTLRGDFGESIYFKTPAAPLIFAKLETTMVLGVLSLAFALAVSIQLLR
jgi:ABC-type dipeptide/oligopeptide/nickel transport system permease component